MKPFLVVVVFLAACNEQSREEMKREYDSLNAVAMRDQSAISEVAKYIHDRTKYPDSVRLFFSRRTDSIITHLNEVNRRKTELAQKIF